MTKNSQAPNVLLIQADQMSAKALSSYGHPVVKTPNIDKLAEQGVVFQNAYCNFPLCAPSRMSMLTGRYANNIGVWDNASEAPACQPTLMHYLRELDYQTTLVGKMHFIGPDQLHGYEERLTTDIYPSNFAWTPDWVNVGEGDRPTGINLSGIIQAGACYRSLQIDYDDEVEYFATRKLYDLARYEKRPFFLTVSFTQPHSPYVARQKFWDIYKDEDIDLPEVPAIPVEEMDPMSRWIYHGNAAEQYEITDEAIRNARHAYYAMISDVDDKVGNLLRVLDECGLAENTIVVFVADHGDMLGERGQWYKKLFYEWSSRVPFIMRWPGHFKPGRIEECTSLVDLMPTLLELVEGGKEIAMVDPLDGQSLAPFLRDGVFPGHDGTVISEYSGEAACAPCRMVRKDRYKYIYTHGEPDLLYDLQVDPKELHDISRERADICAEMRATALAGWDPEQVLARIVESQRQRLFIKRATKGLPQWAYMVFDNDDRRYVRNGGATQTKALARFPHLKP